jgi:hypothetical protein
MLKSLFLFIWQLPQYILGVFFYLLIWAMNKRDDYSIDKINGTKIVYVKMFSAVSFGNTIYLHWAYKKDTALKFHMLGHVLLSRILGPLYFLFAIYSFIKNTFYRIGILKYNNYYEQWHEKLTDYILEEYISDKPSLKYEYENTDTKRMYENKYW